ncbi:hypothetical protein APR04_004514 [Promicromonospora umidemergens]|nr:hypothetical protein [Promicromonospora umidemergens]
MSGAVRMCPVRARLWARRAPLFRAQAVWSALTIGSISPRVIPGWCGCSRAARGRISPRPGAKWSFRRCRPRRSSLQSRPRASRLRCPRARLRRGHGFPDHPGVLRSMGEPPRHPDDGGFVPHGPGRWPRLFVPRDRHAQEARRIALATTSSRRCERPQISSLRAEAMIRHPRWLPGISHGQSLPTCSTPGSQYLPLPVHIAVLYECILHLVPESLLVRRSVPLPNVTMELSRCVLIEHDEFPVLLVHSHTPGRGVLVGHRAIQRLLPVRGLGRGLTTLAQAMFRVGLVRAVRANMGGIVDQDRDSASLDIIVVVGLDVKVVDHLRVCIIAGLGLDGFEAPYGSRTVGPKI